MNRIYKVALKRNAPNFPCPKSGMGISLEQHSVPSSNLFSNFTQTILNTFMSVALKFKVHIVSCIMKDIKMVKKIADRNPIGVKTKGKSKKRWRDEVINNLKKLELRNRSQIVKDRKALNDLMQKTNTHAG
jgi:hypothetical protein